jgi:uncharacterized integral membrane protein
MSEYVKIIEEKEEGEEKSERKLKTKQSIFSDRVSLLYLFNSFFVIYVVYIIFIIINWILFIYYTSKSLIFSRWRYLTPLILDTCFELVYGIFFVWVAYLIQKGGNVERTFRKFILYLISAYTVKKIINLIVYSIFSFFIIPSSLTYWRYLYYSFFGGNINLFVSILLIILKLVIQLLF